MLEKASRIGFDAVEIGMNNTNFDCTTVKNKVNELHMELTLCGAFTKGRDISSFDPDVRENTKKYFIDCLKTAERLGAKVFAGPVYAGGGKAHLLSSDDKKREWCLAVDGLREMALVAKECGVTIGLEPINRYKTSVVNTGEQALNMIKDIGCTNIGILFDTYQANIEEDSVCEALELVCKADRLVHFHACGTNRGVPGTGHLPWNDIADILKRYGYKGHITMESFVTGGMDGAWRELEPSQDILAQKGFLFLKQLLDHNCC